MKIKIAGSLALAAAIFAAPYCQAQDYLDLLRGVINKNGGSSMTQSVIITNMNTRQAQLDSQITAGATSGQLSTQEEAELRADLNRIANLQGQYLASGKLSDFAVQNLLTEYNNVTMKLQTYLSNTTVAGNSSYNSGWFNRYGRGNMAGDPGDQTRFRANIDTKQAMIDATINQAAMAGTLSWSEARSFRNQLNAIASTENRLLADGRLSYRDSRSLISTLNELETQVNIAVANGQRYGRRNTAGRRNHGGGSIGTSIDARQSFIMQRIQRGIASGRLTQREASSLMRDAQQLDSLEARLKQTNGGMSYAEQHLLVAQIDQLNKKVSKELSDRQVQ